MRKILAAAAIAAALVGCASSETVHLRKPADGAVVQCGPYTGSGVGYIAELAYQTRLRDCVVDYQIQGFERIP